MILFDSVAAKNSELSGFAGPLPASRWAIGASRIGTMLRLWTHRWLVRRELSQLLSRDERFFKDIGVSRATVLAESDKGFWRT